MVRKKIKGVKKGNLTPSIAPIQVVQDSRNGGSFALSGYSFQLLYTCYLILSELDETTTFHLEGIEDLDHYKCEIDSASITHIQIKYSTAKQDASFLKSVLKNFLEVYLIDKMRIFKLVYDFNVANGNLKNLFNGNVDHKTYLHWDRILMEIKEDNPQWNWEDFSTNNFLKSLQFEYISKSKLTEEIQMRLINRYNIFTDNIRLYVNGIEVYCLKKMELRESVNLHELNILIQEINDDISKGIQNPAYKWVNKINFNVISEVNDLSYFEGKKATVQDIVRQLPIRRLMIEKEIEDSIESNRITVIKASSGQGKSTIAYQVVFNLKDKYSIYQLTLCNELKEIDNIVEYFKIRVKLGEKPIIFIDNLDSQFKHWNNLVEDLQEEVAYNYKILITTRESDWFSYRGDISRLRLLSVHNLLLNQEEAKDIYRKLLENKKVHNSITDWRSTWAKVEDKKLLIEFVYLITHGEMMSDRIAYQISKINETHTGKIKCEILRKVCFGDICGIKIPVSKLIESLIETSFSDYNEILKSIENEFLISINSLEKYIEGVHPVRSRHVVDILHEFFDIGDTALQVTKITDTRYLSKLISNFPQLSTNKDQLYSSLIEFFWNEIDLSKYLYLLQGLLSGSAMHYFQQSHKIFNDANDCGGLFLLEMSLNPFAQFEEFDFKLDTLEELVKIFPDNDNIRYLIKLRDSAPKINLNETDIYIFGYALFRKLQNYNLDVSNSDLGSYATITYWLMNIHSSLNLSSNYSLDTIWRKKEKYSIEEFSNFMYSSFCRDKVNFRLFAESNISEILLYLKHSTNSMQVTLNDNANEIHVKYILLQSQINRGNEESVKRLVLISKILPIFDLYSSDAIKPTYNFLSDYKIPHDDHKIMPIRNLFIMFHQEFVKLWSDTILSNFECSSTREWVEHWLNLRNQLNDLIQNCNLYIIKVLEKKIINQLVLEIEKKFFIIDKELRKEYIYPNQSRPFEERVTIINDFNIIKSDYFGSIQNFLKQLGNFMSRDLNQDRLTINNLRKAQTTLIKMHNFFEKISEENGLLQQHLDLLKDEQDNLRDLAISCFYYINNEPNEYRNKYYIKEWYTKYCEQQLLNTLKALSDLNKLYSITYPINYYFEDVFKYYPIIVNGFSNYETSKLEELLYLCNPISELDYDYLVIAFKNQAGEIIRDGVKVSINFIKIYKTAIEQNNLDLLNGNSRPLPTMINQQFLDCFKHKEIMQLSYRTGYEGLEKILELLWAYSRSKKELIYPEDEEYLSRINGKVKKQIQDLLKSYKHQKEWVDFLELTKTCEDTLNGNVFDDKLLNDYIDRIISHSTK